MPKLNQLFTLIVISCISSAYADVSNSDLTGLINKVIPAFPGCSQADDYWAEQLGADYVESPSMPASAAYLQGDNVTGQESAVHYVEGNVIAYKEDKTMMADWLIYNQNTSRAIAGNVVLTRQYDAMTGGWIDYYFNLDSGIIKQAAAKDKTTNMYVAGEQIKIFNKDKYRAESGFFTSCDPRDPAWHITSQTTDIDYQDSQGVARHAVFYVESLPVAYMPYFQFPLGKRKSGFLIPEMGAVNSDFFVGTPYYWNMAPNYDMTIEPKLFLQSGLMITDQFRYLTENGIGEIYTEQLPSDWQTGQHRYYWHLVDTHAIAKDWTAGYTYNGVSDDNYFVDFGNFNSMVDNINLERSAYARYKPYWGLFDVSVQGYQTLNPSGQPSAPAIYSELPQINFNINQIQLSETLLKMGLNSQFTQFSSGQLDGILNSNDGQVSALQDGTRLVFYPSMTLPLQSSWGYITPKLGYSYTYYSLQPYSGFYPSGAEVTRGLPITSVDTGLYFDRPVNWFNSSFIQTLEPRLYYLYIPQTNQADLPVFDTATASPSLNQLFSENRFSGYDRINSANDLTLGMTSRLLNDNTGSELANWGVGYRYYLTPSNNLIYGSYTQFGQLYQPTPNFITELNNNWANNISTAATFQYDNLFNNVDGYSMQVRYKPDTHKIFNVRYSYQYQMPVFYYSWSPGQGYNPVFTENQQAVDVSGQWPLFSEKWLLDARSNYDFTRSQFLNLLGGIEYNGGCWSVGLVYEQYLTNLVNYNQAYYVQFTLGGLAGIGTGDPTSELKMNIPGYAPITTVH